MSTSKTCILCHNSLAEPLEKDSPSQETINLAQEINSIDYLLREVPAWRANKLIYPNAEQELFRFYGSRRYNLVQNLLPQNNQKSAEPIPIPTTTNSSPVVTPTINSTFVVKPISKTEDSLTLDINLTEPLQTPSQPNIEASPKTSRSYIPPPFLLTPPPPQKPLGELVSENINYIFAACAALFVGGVVTGHFWW